MVGRDVYEKLINGYTEKQWNRSCKELLPFIIKRLPVRFIYDNNYFTDPYQGFPRGYTEIIEKLLEGIDICLGIGYKEFPEKNATGSEQSVAYDKVLYTGIIDEYFDYKLGKCSIVP